MSNSRTPSDWSVPGAGIVVDSVDYQVHYFAPSNHVHSASENSDLQLRSPSALLDRCMDAIAPLLCGYLWHRDSFSLCVVQNAASVQQQGVTNADPDRPSVWSLSGKTAYGDNIEDEWFIVYLLKCITECVPGTVASVRDNSDGEFLLIEAADALPEWVTPDTTQDRVYLHNGHIHLIPQPSSPAMIGIVPIGPPDVVSAVGLVAGIPRRLCDTRAPAGVTRAIERRLAVYPDHARASQHTARCYIPRDIAAIVALRPDLVAPAVNAFYLRDPVDMKRCAPMATFRPATRVMASITFTRCLYAQLMHQRFEAGGSVFGRRPAPTSKDFKAHDLGAKLAVGFEILAGRGAFVDVTSSVAPSPLSASMDDVITQCCKGPRWESFLRTLRFNGYFRGNIEGSREFNRLKREACEFFATDIHESKSSAGNTARGSPTYDSLSYLDQAAVQLGTTLSRVRTMREPQSTSDRVEAAPQEAPPDVVTLGIRDDVDDDDAWLTLGESALDQMVRDRWGNEPHPDFTPSSVGASGAQMETLVNTMKGFVQSKSSHEGAEVADDLSQYFEGGDNEGEFDDDSDEDVADGDGDRELFGETLGGADGDVSFLDFGAFEQTLQSLLNASATSPARGSAHTYGNTTSDTYPDASTRNGNTAANGHKVGATVTFASTGTATGASGTHGPPSELHHESEAEDSANEAEVGDNNDDIEALSSLMDQELAGTDVGQTFTRAGPDDGLDQPAPTDPTSPLEPIDIDVNLVRNVLQSYSAQQGLAGPVSTLLGSLGIVLPHDDDDVTDTDGAPATKTN